MRLRIPVVLLLGLLVAAARGEDAYENAPIEYSRSTPANGVARLQNEIERGEVALKFDEAHGYLPALLQALRVPAESQMLVFSKTSLQRHRITPKTPRAIYFSDEVYVGYCQAGDVLEISVADPALGAVFYSLDQQQVERPALVRQTHRCLLCHSASHTGNVPSHLVRSVFTDGAGMPLLAEGTFRVDHTTPLENRWGGWYVTGTHGGQTHLGNLVVRDGTLKRPIENAAGHNVTDLSPRLPVAKYLTPHSDLVALMVFEHQALMHNLIARANFATRQALHYEKELNRALDQPAGQRLESTQRRIESAGDALVAGLLFAGEAPLKAPIAGTSDFAKQFASAGPRDAQGRSLREFDLAKRIFKYPCSYLIYSPAFDGLPPEMKAYVARKLRRVLHEADASQKAADSPHADQAFGHLSAADRRAIWEILSSTKPDLLKQPDPPEPQP